MLLPGVGTKGKVVGTRSFVIETGDEALEKLSGVKKMDFNGGEMDSNHGKEDSKRGEMDSNHGDEDSKRGETDSNHGGDHSKRGEMDSNYFKGDPKQGETDLNLPATGPKHRGNLLKRVEVPFDKRQVLLQNDDCPFKFLHN